MEVMEDTRSLSSSSAGLFIKGKTEMAEQIAQPEDVSVGFCWSVDQKETLKISKADRWLNIDGSF